MSRQRIRASVLESTMKPCPHCGGTGHVRSDSSVALMVVRAIEEFLLKDSRHHITVRTPAATALYVLNHKRSTLIELEKRFGVTITVEADESTASQHYVISRGAIAEKPEGFVEIRTQTGFTDEDEPEDDIVIEDEEEAEETSAEQAEDGHGESQRDRKRRRRRRRRGGRDRDQAEQAQEAGSDAASDSADEAAEEAGEESDTSETVSVKAEEDAQPKKRRRGKRGGRRNRAEDEENIPAAADAGAEAEETGEGDVAIQEPAAATQPEAGISEAEPTVAEVSLEIAAEVTAEPDKAEAPKEEAPAEKPKRARRTRKAKAEEVSAEAAATEASPQPEPAPEAEAAPVIEVQVAPEAPVLNGSAGEAPAEKPKRTRRKAVVADAPAEPVVSSAVADTDAAAAPAEEKPKRGGWWQRKGFF